MSVIFTRIATPVSGRLGDAAKFMKVRAEALESAYGIKVGVNARMGGPVGQMGLVSYHDSLAELEDVRRKIIADVTAGKLPTPEAGVFAHSNDSIWLRL